MKVYQPNEVKNIALVGSSGSGKTTLSESMLQEGGIIHRRGDIEHKSTVSDYNEIEQEQMRSVFSTVLYAEIAGKKINFIDTPGMDDFVGQTVTALSVVDTALMVVNATQGVEVGTEIIGRMLKKNGKPMILAVNHIDSEKVNFEKTIEELNHLFGNKVAIVQYPVNAGLDFNSVIDVLKMKMLKSKPDGGQPEVLDIPSDEKAKAEELHGKLIETAAENDDKLMELFFENGTLSEEQLNDGILKGIAGHNLFPLFCISAKKNLGVHTLMEFIANVAPSASNMPFPKTTDGKEIACNINGPTSLFVFKTSVEPHLGEISYFKVMSGKISEGQDVINKTKENKERITQIYAVAGKNRVKVTEMLAGDIGATVKLKETRNNDTLNAKEAEWKFPVIVLPEPRFRTAIKTVVEGEEEKMGEYLQKMHMQDPSIIVEYSKELKQIIVHGQGEFHINIIKWYFDHIYKLGIEFIAPKIPYRETITKIAQADYRHKKQSGGAGQFGEVYMIIEPYEEGKPDPKLYKIGDKEYSVQVRGKDEINLDWGGKLIYYNCIVGGSIDARFLPAILKGIMEKMEEGPLTGSYARDIRVAVYDGKMHPVDSNEISFKLAGRNAFKMAFKNAGPKILEPVYTVEVLVPADYMGDIMSDLQGRRAMIEGMASDSGYEKITAKVPLAELNKYSTALSSISSGKATYTMRFSHYAAVPGEIQDKLLKEYEAQEKEE